MPHEADGRFAEQRKGESVPKPLLFPAVASHVKLATVIVSDAKAKALVEPYRGISLHHAERNCPTCPSSVLYERVDDLGTDAFPWNSASTNNCAKKSASPFTKL
jgi:hypothetical protein